MNDAPTPAQKIRFAIPTPALHERAMRLLEKKKFHGLAWVLAEFVRRGESIPSGILRALLDGDSIEAAEEFLALVVDQDAIEVAPDLAASLAAQVPRTRDAGILYGLLQVLTLLDAPSHLAAFHAALSSIDLQVQSVALRGITAARRAESEPVLLDFLHGKPEPPQAARALAALLILGSEEAVAKAVHLVLDLAALEESTDEDPDWLVDFDDALGPDGCGDLPFTRVEEVFGLLVHEDMLEVLKPFFPTADSAAARRATAVFTPERRQELKEVLEGKDLFILTEYLAECGIEAAALASADEPRFVSMGGRISAFLKAVLDAPGLHQAVEVQGDVIPIFCGMLLAKAIRGRETLVEYRECGRDPERLAGLLAVDEAWIDASRFREIAATLREGGPALEACRKIAQTRDPFASGNCRFLLAALEPDDRIWEAAIDFDFEREDALNLVSAAVKVGGDAYCRGVIVGMEEDRFSDLTWFPGMVLDSLRSETASSALERHWDGIAEHTEARVFLRLVAWTGKAAMAEKAIESLRTGELGLANALANEHARDDLRLALEAFRELTGVRFDRVGVLRSALAAYKRLHPSAPDADDEDEDEELEDETEDETESREGDEAPRHRHGGHESGVCHCCGRPYGPESFTEASVPLPALESLLDRGAFLVPPEYGEILEPARDSPSMRPDTIYEDDPEDTAPVEPVVREEPKVGRNDPCPCGSGKKFKKCCGK